MKKFTQDYPASRFGEAYPVGNGHMGAVVYGSFPVERLVLTENTFFSGKRSSHNNRKGAAEAFYEMRELIKREDYKGAHEVAKRFHGVRGNYGTSLPVGDLEIEFLGNAGLAGTGVNDMDTYLRSLDYEKGIVQTVCKKDNCEVISEAFASYPDKVLVWHAESNEILNLAVKFLPYHKNGEIKTLDNDLLYMSQALETVHCDTPCGTILYGRCEVVTDGKIIKEKGSLRIEKASQITLYLMAQTDYELLMEGDAESGISEETRRKFVGKVQNIQLARGEELRQKSYTEVRNAHTEDVSSLMNRVSLELNGATQEGAVQAEKAAQLFQYGRYLLLSASREDSILPTQLQGIWNDDVACRIGWTCDMHLDINTQMNYWPADVTNLPEVLPPLFRWTKRLAKEGEQTAQESYSLNGWAAELVSNAWCFSAPYWAVPISPYPTGGAWLLSHVWEHYNYTKNEEILKDFYPVIEGAAEFFSGYVFENAESGILSSGPSISAENSFWHEGETYQISNGCTYEIAVIREVFRNYTRVNELLGKGGKLAEKIKIQLEKLPDFRILPDGTLAEWSHDYPAADTQHRHTSHLISLFPFAQITPEETPELAQAAERVIEKKLTPYENWEDTGWARSLLILYEARLHHGEKAWFHVLSMIKELQEPNSMIYHPPTRGTVFDDDFGHVYELDGNTGLTSGIAEMLLQSHNGVLRFLPAVPKEWNSGHVKGLKARGGITVDIHWKDGKITEFILEAKKDCTCNVKVGERIMQVALKENIPYKWNE